jgi:hypothetical protein
MQFCLQHIVVLGWLCGWTAAFPSWSSLAGLSNDEINAFTQTVIVIGAQPPPGPDQDTLPYLVNDADHPYQPPRPSDIRGPCPALNTLASHGVSHSNYLL